MVLVQRHVEHCVLQPFFSLQLLRGSCQAKMLKINLATFVETCRACLTCTEAS